MSSSKVGILVEFNFEDAEVIYPLYRFQEAGYTTVTIGPVKDTVYKGKHGYPMKADLSIDDISAKDLAALIIPGGWAPAICHGPWMFCSCKMLNGKRATGFVAIKDDMENAGAIFEDSAVAVDGNMITSRTPKDLPEFCKAVLAKLETK